MQALARRRLRRRLGVLGAVIALALAAVVVAAARGPATVKLAPSSHCGGIERWDVKTLSDPAARSVRFRAKDTTIERLRQQVPPGPIGGHLPRSSGVESQVWRLKDVFLVDARLVTGSGGDEDIHLVIRDQHPTHTMIVEFPDVRCRGAAVSHKKDAMRRARADFLRACGEMPRKFVDLRGRATLSGVGFFDRFHKQRGVAPNVIELHPVLRFTASSCSRG